MCNDCPQDVPFKAPESPVQGLPGASVVWTGGPPEAHLAALRHTLSLDHVTIHDDGSIEYQKTGWEPPRPIDGYVREGWTFRPVWPSCQLRTFRIAAIEACQCVQVFAGCINPAAACGQPVKCEDCQRCEHRLPIPHNSM